MVARYLKDQDHNDSGAPSPAPLALFYIAIPPDTGMQLRAVTLLAALATVYYAEDAA